jgi:WD40 repeat protein
MSLNARSWQAVVCFLTLAAVCLLPLAWCYPVVAYSEGWGEVTALCFFPDGKTAIAACQDDNKLRIYDVATGKERLTIDAHKNGVWAAAASPDGKFVATGGGDHLVRLWDAVTFKEIRSFAGHTKEVLAIAFSPDGKTLASGGADRTIRTWDIETANQKKLWHGHELKVLSVAFSPDGKTLASGGMCSASIPGFVQGATHADQVRLFDVQTGTEIRKLGQHGSTVFFSPDGRSVAAAGNYVLGIPREGGTASVSRGTKATFGPVLKDGDWMSMKGVGSALAMSPDGRLLALGSGSQLHQARTQGKFGRNWVDDEIEHNRISLWETATGKEIMQLPHSSITVLAISPDGKKLAAGSVAGQVQILDLAPEGWSGKLSKLTAKDMESLWAELAQESPEPAYAAIWTMSAAGKSAVAFLKDKMEPQKSAGNQANELLVKLDSDKYAVREAAFRDLRILGPAIEAELRRAAVDDKTSAEVRKRVAKLLESWEKRPASPEELRQARALQVLERIGDLEARGVLARLAQGAPGAWLTEQAAGALKRVERRMN